MNRFFHRCKACLTVVATEGRMPAKAECAACGRAGWWFMGEVHVDRLVKVEERCACDDRCTSATGPKCGCKCGGANHGTGRVVTVVLDQGGVPRVATPASDEARRIADEWEAARTPLVEELMRLNAGGWLPPESFNRKLSLQWRLLKANKLKTHAARLRALGGK